MATRPAQTANAGATVSRGPRVRGNTRWCARRLVRVPVRVPVAVAGLLLVLFRLLDDQSLGRQEHAGDGGGVLHRGAGDLDRGDNTLRRQGAVPPGGGVV